MRSNLNGDEQKTWHKWYINPRGGDEHLTSAGSRARGKSMPVNEGWRDRFARDPLGHTFKKPTKEQLDAEIDELYDRMVKRGVVKRERKAK